MSIQIPSASWDFRGFLLCFIFFSSLPGTILTQEVTLDSVQIFTTHDWFSTKPTVFFQCKGENKTVLPDVKRTNVSYSFNGEESWQPLTELQGTKCKRCGIYEDDPLKYDTFDEWELCPSDFTAEGSYKRFKEKEFNATFLCHGCSQVGAGSNKESGTEKEEQKGGMHPGIVVLIVVLLLGVVAVGLLVGYKYWRKKKRQQEQARFLKLFEDGDDIEDELGLENTL
ncbi:putative protein [Arabidopsis thaliana]|jgi:hypothetical protein|uniref:At3g53490 n=1 Tax=Arabidopsis thaliana TaxID=3702 RepID=Q9LFG9_ARATH|nr:valine-tRNA ligase [Arabidopsis thaliana]AAR24676.1 At3g53490 [Arabidopsis thaliana]AEE79096.1 valine-tRNA ligase [Arabidopsis thaliana]CAB67656.1 putative protein [Arabidopsis thaliana]|eukprot:NP_190917.1 valine-tRNA ligase [Arabidopsis thaliana]